ncbi:MAG: hypothetical protein ACRCX2_03950 [Paraclostridium sp.]
MAINKQALAQLIAEQTGNSDFNEDMITDDLLAGLVVDEEVVEDDVEDDVDENTDTDTDDTENDDSEDEEISLDNIDVNSLSATERIFYDVIVSERKKAKQREISAVITNAGVNVKHKLVLDRMAKSGVDIVEIKKTIEDFKEIESSITRSGGKGIVISKSKVKKKTETSDKTPKSGTKDFGKMLAQLKLKNKNLGGNK